MSTVTLYSGDYGTLTLERTNKRHLCIMRANYSSVMLPVAACAHSHMVLFFGNTTEVHNHAHRLDWDDTQNVITKIVGDTADMDVYKPSCVLHYSISVTPSSNNDYMALTFSVYYHLWKRDTSTTPITFEDLITDTIDFSFRMTAEEYLKFLYMLSMGDGTEANTLWSRAVNDGMITTLEIYDFGDAATDSWALWVDYYDFHNDADDT